MKKTVAASDHRQMLNEREHSFQCMKKTGPSVHRQMLNERESPL
jgi:hypothetical protein